MNHGTAEAIQPILHPSSGFSLISVNTDRHFLKDFDYKQPTIFPGSLFQSCSTYTISLLFLALCKVNRENKILFSFIQWLFISLKTVIMLPLVLSHQNLPKIQCLKSDWCFSCGLHNIRKSRSIIFCALQLTLLFMSCNMWPFCFSPPPLLKAFPFCFATVLKCRLSLMCARYCTLPGQMSVIFKISKTSSDSNFNFLHTVCQQRHTRCQRLQLPSFSHFPSNTYTQNVLIWQPEPER